MVAPIAVRNRELIRALAHAAGKGTLFPVPAWVLRIVEGPAAEDLFTSQMATPGEQLNQIRGSMPSLSNLPGGCAFHPRCDFIKRADGQTRPACVEQVPGFTTSGNCQVACHMVAEMQEDRRLKEEGQ
jgi:oligopeptide/dipeptide ABC transporter ATP-binding protein